MLAVCFLCVLFLFIEKLFASFTSDVTECFLVFLFHRWQLEMTDVLANKLSGSPGSRGMCNPHVDHS